MMRSDHGRFIWECGALTSGAKPATPAPDADAFAFPILGQAAVSRQPGSVRKGYTVARSGEPTPNGARITTRMPGSSRSYSKVPPSCWVRSDTMREPRPVACSEPVSPIPLSQTDSSIPWIASTRQ